MGMFKVSNQEKLRKIRHGFLKSCLILMYFCFSCYVIVISFFSLKMNFSYCKKKKIDFAAIPEADSLCICI